MPSGGRSWRRSPAQNGLGSPPGPVPASRPVPSYARNVAYNLAGQLVESGANGLVLFNRFYQPDLDIEAMEVLPALELSSSAELRLPLRWIAILHRR